MQEKVNKIYNGNNLDVLKGFQDNSICTILTDFPYALSDVDPLKMIKDGVNNKHDFMGRSWTLPTVEMLKEFYRVLKTGGFMITTFTPRQDLQTVLIYRLMEAGFDVSFSPIYWAYCSGFPKASNYSKNIDKHFNAEREVVGKYMSPRQADRGTYKDEFPSNIYNYSNSNNVTKNAPHITTKDITRPTTPEAIYCDGLYSLSAKPAVEPILIAQKPHGKAKYKQALDWYYERKELLDKGIPEEDLSLYTKNSSGGVFFDNTRIPCINDEENLKRPSGISIFSGKKIETGGMGGRFPANLLCGFPISKEELRSEYPEATEEELDKMVSMIENPIDVGRVFSVRSNPNKEYVSTNNIKFASNPTFTIQNCHKDSGDLSRYFSLTAWSKKHFPNLHNIAEKTLQLQDDVEKTGDCLFVAKPSQSEKNAGLDGFETAKRQNTHVCVKPITLYNYLITLFSKEGDIILDPFCGSGVTPIACTLTNRRYIGIEMEAEYCKIAEARVEYWKQQKEGIKIPYASKRNVSASIEEKQESLL